MSDRETKVRLPAKVSALALFVMSSAAGCGGSESLGVILSMDQALSEDVESVTLLVFDADVSCVGLAADPGATLLQPHCDEDRQFRCIHSRHELTLQDTDEGVQLFVSEGRHYFFGVGFDSVGEIIATGCNGPLDIEEGKSSAIRMILD